MNHESRYKIAVALLKANIPENDIIECFKGQDDFNEKVTRYQLDYLRDNI